MNVQQFCDLMESIAPKSLALEYDNVGLLIAPDHDRIETVLVALDLTVDVAREAVDGGYDLVLTHHPIFWDPVKSFSATDFDTAAAYTLIRHGVGHFAAHTNLDACEGGVNDVLASILGLTDVRPLPPENLGRIGILPKSVHFSEFAAMCDRQLQTKGRFVGDPAKTVSRIAVIGGSGGGDVDEVYRAGCDGFVTGEMKHHQALRASYLGLSCCVLGHYETEFPVLNPLITRLQNASNDVQYVLIHAGSAPLRSL